VSQRKISIRRIVQTLVTLLAVTGCVMALVSADRVQSVRKVKDVQIQIRNAGVVHFVSESEVCQMLFGNRHIDVQNLPLARLDVQNMEHIARSNPWVADAQVYVDNNRSLHVFVTQRVPVVRVFESSGQSYYLDTALQSVPVSDQYSHYTTVFTNVPALHPDSTGNVSRGIIVWLSQYISRHAFWNAQIAEVAMADDNTFELIPILGKQRIIIGDTSRLDEKLANLLSFYKQVQNKVGWDRYKILDLRYAGQVVASPALPWKVPVDKALSSMSWVKAVMDATPINKADADPDTVVSVGTPQVAMSSPPPAVQAAPAPQKPVRQTEKDKDKKKKITRPTADKKPDKRPKPATIRHAAPKHADARQPKPNHHSNRN